MGQTHNKEQPKVNLQQDGTKYIEKSGNLSYKQKEQK